MPPFDEPTDRLSTKRRHDAIEIERVAAAVWMQANPLARGTIRAIVPPAVGLGSQLWFPEKYLG